LAKLDELCWRFRPIAFVLSKVLWVVVAPGNGLVLALAASLIARRALHE